ncbi:hypothetical protein [Colwellia sp. TT2012]|uniref:hypothetical protein n=1 Tax=Colwellia sp. TT2012 TaxID=1720342 RepID=UPI00070C9C30|nr:hypothetical protein [Colwellia sp. TT2012]
MFLSFIPAWFACCILYGSSSKQKVFKKSLPILVSRVTVVILLALMLIILLQHLPTVSALITALSLLCCFLPLVTLISAYKKYYLQLSSALICLLALSSPFVSWLAVMGVNA